MHEFELEKVQIQPAGAPQSTTHKMVALKIGSPARAEYSNASSCQLEVAEPCIIIEIPDEEPIHIECNQITSYTLAPQSNIVTICCGNPNSSQVTYTLTFLTETYLQFTNYVDNNGFIQRCTQEAPSPALQRRPKSYQCPAASAILMTIPSVLMGVAGFIWAFEELPDISESEEEKSQNPVTLATGTVVGAFIGALGTYLGNIMSHHFYKSITEHPYQSISEAEKKPPASNTYFSLWGGESCFPLRYSYSQATVASGPGNMVK